MDNLVKRYDAAKEELLDRFRVIVGLIRDVCPCEFHDTQFTDNEIEIYVGEDYVVFHAESPVPYEDWDYTARLEVPTEFFCESLNKTSVIEYYQQIVEETQRQERKENLIHALQTVRQCGVTAPHELLARAEGATTYKEIVAAVEQYLEDGYE